jgi:hypothetical protein
MGLETKQNVRCTHAEKEAWRKAAPSGNISKWLRELANRELANKPSVEK